MGYRKEESTKDIRYGNWVYGTISQNYLPVSLKIKVVFKIVLRFFLFYENFKKLLNRNNKVKITVIVTSAMLN